MALDPQPWLVDPALRHELVDVFSGMEHALKAVGFNRDPHGRIEADWDAFALAIQSDYEKLQDPQLLDATKFLVTAPPRREVKSAEGIGWENIPRPPGLSDMEWRLRIVRQVRNNYVHGGKRSPKAPVEPGRDQKLVESSLTVLRACTPLNAEVSAAYEAVAF